MIYSDGRSFVYPDLSVYNMEVPLSYITGTIGVSLEAEKVFLIPVVLTLVTNFVHTCAFI